MDDADLQQRQAILESIARRHFLEHAGELGELRHPDRCLTALWGPLSFKEMKAVLLLTNNEDGACDWDTFRGFVFEDATRYERLAVAKRGLFAELKASWGMASRPAPSSSERRPTFLRAVAGDGDEEGGWGGAGQGSTELADPAGLWGVSSEGGITGKEYSYEEDDDDDEGKGEARGSGGGGGLGVGQDLRQGQGQGQGQGQEQGAEQEQVSRRHSVSRKTLRAGRARKGVQPSPARPPSTVMPKVMTVLARVETECMVGAPPLRCGGRYSRALTCGVALSLAILPRHLW